MAAQKLSEDDVRMIRKLRASGVKYAVIAEGFGVALSTVFQVVERVTYKDVPDAP